MLSIPSKPEKKSSKKKKERTFFSAVRSRSGPWMFGGSGHSSGSAPPTLASSNQSPALSLSSSQPSTAHPAEVMAYRPTAASLISPASSPAKGQRPMTRPGQLPAAATRAIPLPSLTDTKVQSASSPVLPVATSVTPSPVSALSLHSHSSPTPAIPESDRPRPSSTLSKFSMPYNITLVRAVVLPVFETNHTAPLDITDSGLVLGGSLRAILEYLLMLPESRFLSEAENFIGGYREYAKGSDIVQELLQLAQKWATEGKGASATIRQAALNIWLLADLMISFCHSIDFAYERGLLKSFLLLLDSACFLSNAESNKWKLRLLNLGNSIGNPRSVSELQSLPEETPLLGVSAEELALQMTLHESTLLSLVSPTELARCSFNKDDKKEVSPYLTRMAENFNAVACWVASSVLSGETPKDRANAIVYFICLAKELRRLNNFNSLMMVLSGLGMSPVSRLKQSWALVSSANLQKKEQLDHLMNPIRNYSNYKVALVELKGSTCRIPYLAASLRDLFNAALGNPQVTENGAINYQRLTISGSIIFNILKCGEYHYEHPEIPSVIRQLSALVDSQSVDQDAMYEQSAKLEPPAVAIDTVQLDSVVGSSSSSTSVEEPIYQVDPAYWTPNHVRQWLELMELPDYITPFSATNGQQLLASRSGSAVPGIRIGIRHRFNRSLDILNRYRRCGPWDLKTKSSWSCDDVCGWLRFEGYGIYEAAFRDHAIVGDHLSTLVEDDLKQIGVDILGIRKRLLVFFRMPSLIHSSSGSNATSATGSARASGSEIYIPSSTTAPPALKVAQKSPSMPTGTSGPLSSSTSSDDDVAPMIRRRTSTIGKAGRPFKQREI